MLLGIDHLVIACADPDAAVADLERDVGLRPGGGGRHEALGTFNRLVWLGDTYLELIGVFDRLVAERSWLGGPTVRALDAGGAGFVTWAVASDDIDADIARLNGGRADLTDPIDGERRRPDGALVRWRLSRPRELAPDRPPFLIEHDVGAAEWSDADRIERAAEVHPLGGTVRLTTLELPVAEMPATIAGLMRNAGIGPFRPSLAGRGARDAGIGSQTLRLTPRPAAAVPSPVPTLHLVVAAPIEPRTVDSSGCRFVLRAAR